MPNPKFSKVGRENYFQMLEILQAVDQDFVPPLSQRTTLEEYLDNLMDNGHIISVEVDHKHVGFVGYYCEGADYEIPFIRFVGVSKEYQGRGLGRQLSEKCIEDLTERGKKVVGTRTWSTNDSGTALYPRLGFKISDVKKDERGLGIHSIHYEMKLV